MAAVDFDQQSYWRRRFASETAFEWLLSADEFLALAQPRLDRLDASTARILHIGCGTSGLQNSLRARGFLRVANIDYEPLAANRARDLERRTFGDVRMAYAVVDATDREALQALPESDGGFDLVLDKSTSDAVACGGDAPLLDMSRGIRACLSPGGCWIALSFSSQRFDGLPDLPFDVEVLAKVLTPKIRPTDPDVFHWCYLLSPR
jgi:SAM-dependent methyltransferase